MAANKKPRKKYVKKIVKGGHLPVPQSVILQWETRGWNALAALREGRYDREIGLELILILTVIRKVVPNDSTEVLAMLLRAFQTINEIKARFDRTGRWGASGDDLRALEEVIPPLLSLFPQLNRGEMHDAFAYTLGRLRMESPDTVMLQDSLTNAGNLLR